MTPSAPIFIVGYMACGKTTFGRALARRLGRSFVDLDFYIEQRFHSRISEIFATRGEEGFRRMEASMLREIGEMEGVVVACGGGTPCFADNMDYMLGRGTTVWLQASDARLLERLTINRARRPILADKTDDEILAFIRSHIAQRIPHYSRAHITFCGENLENRRQITESVDRFLIENPTLLTDSES